MENKLSKRKAVYMALSVLVAVIIWIFVDVSAGRIVTTEANAVPVEFTGETGLTDRGLMRLEEGTDTTVSLELQGTRWDIAKLDKSQLRVQVDLSGVTATGVQRLSYSIRYPVGYPSKKISLSDANFSTNFTVPSWTGGGNSRDDVLKAVRGFKFEGKMQKGGYGSLTLKDFKMYGKKC